MKHKKSFAACLAMIILFALAGCQLAREDTGETVNTDRLIGVFVTRQYLDLFDMEGYLNDNIHKLSGNSEIMLDGNNDEYQGRLYATLTTRKLTAQETGKTFDTKEFVFEGVEGISYFAATVPASEDHDSFTTSGSDEAISNGQVSLHYGDDENKTIIEGTIYVTPSQGIHCYINPVYQGSDGRVYALSGSGFTAEGDHGEGSAFSQTLEETTTITENGKSKSAYTSVKISIAVMFPPQRILVLEMDEDSAVLSRTEYSPGELPDTLTPKEDTRFILVETYKLDREGNPLITRALYDESNETLETFYGRDDGLCVKQRTQLDWNKD